MDIRMLLSRIKFLTYMKLFIVVLIILGILMVILGNSNIISALFIYFMSIFISYIKTIGMYVLCVGEKYSSYYYKHLDNIITLAIIILFGYKFVNLFEHFVFAILIYSTLWLAYLGWICRKFDKIDDVVFNKVRIRN